MKSEDIKEVVKEKYGAIANQSLQMAPLSCCGSSGCCGETGFSMIGDEYQNVKGYNPDADLGLGCGIPTQFADIKEGDHLLDLGSGAGNDCFIARTLVGESGRITGLDFTDAMVRKSVDNALKLGYSNVTFVKGDIEAMPFPGHTFDIIVSNCVLNLVPDKKRAFAEMMRVLKPSGHFCVSDVVLKGDLPEAMKHDAALYAGCVSGAIALDDYLSIITMQGFHNITLHKQKEILIPEEITDQYLSAAERIRLKNGDAGIYSITVSGFIH